MPTDMQYKDGLRKDKFLNELVIEALKNGEKNTYASLRFPSSPFPHTKRPITPPRPHNPRQ